MTTETRIPYYYEVTNGDCHEACEFIKGLPGIVSAFVIRGGPRLSITMRRQPDNLPVFVKYQSIGRFQLRLKL